MKVCIIQPRYSTVYEESEARFEEQLALLEQCDDTMDVIVCPEMCDVPALTKTKEQFEASAANYHQRMMEAAQKLAVRCNAIVFFNGCDTTDEGIANVTFALNRKGEVVGKYFKQHLTPGEVSKRKLKSRYTFEFEKPTVVKIEGIRFGFLTCYDFYFYEAFAHMARMNLDVIIGCSHQRSDSHEALELMTRFCAYNTNTYIFRASVSMDESSDIGGASMIVAPDGKVLANLYSRVGIATAELDVKKKFYKPAGFGNPPSAHYEYIEEGRRPWKYRHGGSAIVPTDAWMEYPRVCAHRGFNTVAPENSMPAFGSAVAMGAEEIEFDLWPTADGVVVSCHDAKLDRVSDGTGLVYEKTYSELLQYDFGFKTSEEFRGMRILTFEEILKKLACHTVMNIHIKTVDNDHPADEAFLQSIIDLIEKYDCRKHVYFMSGNDFVLEQLSRMAPDITRCCGAGKEKWKIVDRAIKYGCEKVQLFMEYFNQEMIDKAHAHGIKCNYFYADDPEQAKKLLDMGIDTILTNDYNRISQIVEEYRK